MDSPLNLATWETELRNDKDQDFLLDGLSNGFKILPATSDITQVECDNYKSATDPAHRGKVEAQLKEEMRKGNYELSRTKPAIVSALGAIPKKGSDDIRLIHDCSRPEGFALNDYAEAERFSYQTLDDAVKMLQQGSYMAKIDLKSAYRSVPIHPSNHSATGLKWRFDGDSEYSYLFDKRLPFGARLSPSIFDKLSQAVKRMMQRRGFHTIVVYLDDFLIIGSTYDECLLAFQTLIDLLVRLGFEINWRKVTYPTQILTFLGVEINAVERTLSLPADKLDDLRTLLRETCGRKSVSKRELLSLLGKLNWAARVVRGGRTFMRRLIDLSKTLRRPNHRAKLSHAARADIEWWETFMKSFNGVSYFLVSEPISAGQINTDTCDDGGAGFFNGDWFYINWTLDDPSLRECHINEKELFSILHAVRRWGPTWANKRVHVFADSDSAVCAINKGTSPSPAFMPHIRELFWHSAANNFVLTAHHVKGSDNTLADALSRLTDPTCATRAKCELQQWHDQNKDVTRVECDLPHVSTKTLSILPPQASWIAKHP